jgi:uncharacterized protein YggE
MDARIYYQNIRARREELAARFPRGCCVAVSLPSLSTHATPGAACEVSTQIMARLITEGSHRLATDAETAAFHIEMDAERARRAPNSISRLRLLYDETMNERMA